jgi:hypothetical protein
MNDSIQAIICRSVNESSVRKTDRLTEPRTYGVYMLPADCGSTRLYRFGNHPIRRQELEREFKICTLKYLFLHRKDAMQLVALLNA